MTIGGWKELTELLRSPDADLLMARVTIEGKEFDIDAMRIQEFVVTEPVSRLVGRTRCGHCKQQEPAVTCFGVNAAGSCAVTVCDKCLASLTPPQVTVGVRKLTPDTSSWAIFLQGPGGERVLRVGPDKEALFREAELLAQVLGLREAGMTAEL